MTISAQITMLLLLSLSGNSESTSLKPDAQNGQSNSIYFTDNDISRFNNDPETFASKINEGRKHIAEAKYVDAVESFTELLQLSEAINDSLYISTAHTYLCLTNGLVGNAKESLDHAEVANSFLPEKSSKLLSQWARVGLGCAHYLNKNFDLADSLLTKSIENDDPINFDNQYLIYAYQYLAAIRIENGELQDAKVLLEKAINFPNTHHTNALITCLYQLGQVYSKMHETETAHEYFQKAHDLAVKEPDKSILAKIYMHKARFFKRIGDYERSANFYALTDSLYEHVVNAKVSQEVQKVTLNYQRLNELKEVELKRKVLEIEKLKMKRKAARQTALLSILLFTASIIISVFMFNRKRRAQKLAMLEQEISNQKELQLHNYIKGQEEERNRLARDLHDGIGSQMAILKMNLSRLSQNCELNQNVDKLPIRLCDEIYQSLRDVAFNLLPRPLVKEGLIVALQELTRKLTKSSGVEFELNNFGLINRLPEFHEAGIFRITQEITANIIKHSSATMARIDITSDKHSLGITISWNGKGFNTDNLENSSGYGWKNINTRLNQLGGSICIDSTEQGNSSIAIIDIPLNDLKIYGKAG